jgi:hypothetical protein
MTRCVQRRCVQEGCHGLSELEAELARCGVSLYGFADVRGLFGGEWEEWPRAISLALALSVEELRGVWSGGPTPAYYEAYLAANTMLDAVSREVAHLIQHLGYRARPFPATVSAAELRSDLGADLTAPVSHKPLLRAPASAGSVGTDCSSRARSGRAFALPPYSRICLSPSPPPLLPASVARAGVVSMPALPGPLRGMPGSWARPGRPWSMWTPVVSPPSA